MREKVVSIAGAAKLAGIVTLPDVDSLDTSLPGVLILNEGILHRVGAGRLHVKVARKLAKLGLISLRMDHSSIGDSGPRRGTQTFEEASIIEVRTAMDYMTKVYGLERFIIYGLCSGSDVGFEVGVIDARVAGLIQLDAHIFPSRRSRVKQIINHYRPRILKFGPWLRFVGRKISEIRSGRRAHVADVLKEEGRDEWYSDPDYIRVRPPKERVEQGLKVILEKDIPMYVCFTNGDWYGHYNYAGQYRDAFPTVDFRDRLEVQFIVGCTHLFTALAHQEQLLREIETWLRKYKLIASDRD